MELISDISSVATLCQKSPADLYFKKRGVLQLQLCLAELPVVLLAGTRWSQRVRPEHPQQALAAHNDTCKQVCFFLSLFILLSPPRQYRNLVVGPRPEAAVLRGLRPQCHHVGHWGPQGTNVTVAGTPVSMSAFASLPLCLSGIGRLKKN